MKRILAGVVTGVVLVGAVHAQNVLTFRKVDFFEFEGEEEKQRDARMTLDPENHILTFADEKNGTEKATYAAIPYDKITKIVYERSAHRRYGAAILVNPLFLFSRGKKHWLTIEFQDVESLPQGFVYVRLDKDNFRQITSALQAGTGVEVEELTEEGKD